MRVEIWSDIVCPWCAIGKARFEKARRAYEAEGHAAVTVAWRSFELDPSMESDYPGSLNEWLAERKGVSLAQAAAMNDQVTRFAAEEGVTFRMDIAVPANTLKAHALTHYAEGKGLRQAMTERLLSAYFGEGENLNDHGTLLQLAKEVGLDVSEAAKALTDEAYETSVRKEETKAMELGIRGVPFFLFNGKYGVSGAQSAQTFLQALRQIQD